MCNIDKRKANTKEKHCKTKRSTITPQLKMALNRIFEEGMSITKGESTCSCYSLVFNSLMITKAEIHNVALVLYWCLASLYYSYLSNLLFMKHNYENISIKSNFTKPSPQDDAVLDIMNNLALPNIRLTSTILMLVSNMGLFQGEHANMNASPVKRGMPPF